MAANMVLEHSDDLAYFNAYLMGDGPRLTIIKHKNILIDVIVEHREDLAYWRGYLGRI